MAVTYIEIFVHDYCEERISQLLFHSIFIEN